jgi:hypothetical protein
MPGTICVDAPFAILWQAGIASNARTVAAKTSIALSTDADNIANLDIALSLRANSDCDTNDFMSDNTGVFSSGLINGLESVWLLWRKLVWRKIKLTHPDRRVCKSEPQIPECVTLMSTSVSSQGFG